MNSTLLKHPEGAVRVIEEADGKRTVQVEDPGGIQFCLRRKCLTAYPMDLIKKILNVKGPFWICDEIFREESACAVRDEMERRLLMYCERSAFVGSRILDFGAGCGASTVNLCRLFPEAGVVGVEIEDSLLLVARARRDFYGLENVSFLRSPGPNQLTEDIGRFDFIILNAVYEHMLPGERKTLLPTLWSILNPRGALFIGETPYRWSLLELHTSGLPLINFLPKSLLLLFVHSLSNKVQPDTSWETLLRQGVRGGSEKQIMRILKRCRGKPELLAREGHLLSGRLVECAVPEGYFDPSRRLLKRAGKACIRLLLALLHSVTGLPYYAELNLAIVKRK